MYIDALTYPFRQSGWLMILLGAIFAVILDFLGSAPLFGIFVAVFSGGYFGAFYLNIVSSTMTGSEHVPDWPSFSNMLDDILYPFLRIVMLVLISFLPVVGVCAVALSTGGAEWLGPAFIAAIVVGCFYFPMAVLAAQAFGGIGAALPHIVLPAILRAMRGYLLTLTALLLVFGICIALQAVTVDLPFVGWFVASAVALYGMMFQGRLIGLVYLEKQDKLGWD